jgi:hypothetical protein
MAVRFQVFALLGSRTADSPRGVAEPAATRDVLVTLTAEADPRSSSGALVLPCDLPLGLEVVEVELDLTSTASMFSASAHAGVDRYVSITPAGAHAVAVQVAPIQSTTPVLVGSMVVNVPTPCLAMSSTVAAALGIIAGASVPAVLRVRDRYASTFGRSLVGRYIDDAVDPDPSTLVTTEAMMVELGAGGYAARVPLGTPAGSTSPVYVNTASMATVDPLNVVYIKSTDIGVGGTKIPADVASNSAAQYGYHPSVFIRRPQYTRGIAPAAPREAKEITNPGGAAILMVAQYAFTHSAWTVQIDGTEYDIIIDHNGGAYETPLEIYQRVIAARFTDGKVTTYRRFGTAFSPTGVLQRFDFAQYLRFRDGYNNTDNPPFAVYAQTGNEAAAS